jgi:hypothetical protein
MALDTWRCSSHMPCRVAAVRELLRGGLSAEGFLVSDGSTRLGDFGVVGNANGGSIKSRCRAGEIR